MRFSEDFSFNGWMFDFRHWYNVALDATEVDKIYNFNPTTTLPYIWLKMDDFYYAEKNILYDSSGNGVHFELKDTSILSFETDVDIPYSFQNEVGYYIDVLTGNSTYRPRNESDPTKDIDGALLTYSGVVSYPVKLERSMCATFDGVDDYVEIYTPTDIETICFFVKINAEYTPLFSTNSLGAGQIYTNNAGFNVGSPLSATQYKVDGVVLDALAAKDALLDLEWHYVEISVTSVSISYFLVGRNTPALYGNFSIAGLTLKNNDVPVLQIPFCEGNGDAIWDVVGGGYWTIQNYTAANFWGGRQDYFHYNIFNGFEYYDHDLSGDVIRVPYKLNETKITPSIGDYTKTDNCDASYWHNKAETNFTFFDSPKAQMSNIVEYIFDTDGVVQHLSFDTIEQDLNDEHRFMSNNYGNSLPKKSDLMCFNPPVAGDELSDVQDYLGH
jgi:hypothetical protein